MSISENYRIAQEGLRLIEQNRRDVEILQNGLPEPNADSEPVKFLGVTFYPDPSNKCWRVYPASSLPE